MVATPFDCARSRDAKRRENFRSTPRKEFFNGIGLKITYAFGIDTEQVGSGGLISPQSTLVRLYLGI